MKLRLKLLLLTFCSMRLLSAVTPDVPTVLAPIAGQHFIFADVAPVDDTKIDAFRHSVAMYESKRSIIRGLAVTAGVCGIGYMLYKWLTPPTPEPLNTQQAVIDLNTRTNNINNRLTGLENRFPAPAPQDPGLLEQLWGGLRSFGSWVLGWTPSFVQNILKNEAYTQARMILFGSLPFSINAASYLLETYSLQRCMTKTTQFYEAIYGIMNWIFTVMADPHNAQPEMFADLVAHGKIWVAQMEKILGYMRFITSRLDEDLHNVEITRAEACISSIRAELNALANKINLFTKGTGDIPERKTMMCIALKTSLFKIICQMENFSPVLAAAGYPNDFEPFPALKTYILPELQGSITGGLSSPEPDPYQEMLSSMTRVM